jgi:hypothetical protein
MNAAARAAGTLLLAAPLAARAHGGDDTLIRRSDGGLTARLDLPLASTAPTD